MQGKNNLRLQSLDSSSALSFYVYFMCIYVYAQLYS